ncbi:uncharacterized protein (DUF849 family) [Bradyrhizobium sp. USDA 4463]
MIPEVFNTCAVTRAGPNTEHNSHLPVPREQLVALGGAGGPQGLAHQRV